jgi:hypothetical protein
VYKALKMSYNTISEDDFSLVENLSEDFYGVKLNGGEYDGVIVVYGAVSIKMPEDGSLDENANLKFNYNLKDSGRYQPDQLENDPVFCNYLGDVLSYIIVTQLDKQETCIGRPKE